VPSTRKFLEVIVASLEDAREAQAGGADRLEIVRDLDVGGLTPAVALVEQIVRKVATPARVMLRESANFVISSPAERATLRRTLAALGELPIDGIVLGFLRDSRVDIDTTTDVLSAAPHVRATFHRAFEESTAQFADLAALTYLPQVDRILTSGGPVGWPEKAARLEALQRSAGDRITILACGGLTLAGAQCLQAHAALREYHIGAAARIPETLSGAVSSHKVAQFRREAGLDG
jgi:copper homeostasis protein